MTTPDPTCRLAVEVLPGNGPPVLLVHGMLSSRAQWMLNVHALRRVSTPVIVELWGHGRSPLPDDTAQYEPASYIEQFEALRDDLGVERWSVIGQSLGAALTLRYAFDRPERVRAHVFTNSNSALADAAWQQQIRTTAPDVASRIERGGRDAVAAMPVHPAQARRLPEPVKAALVADADAIEPAAVARALRHTVPTSSVRDRVGDNQVPTLLVTGARERSFAEARQFAARSMPMLDIVDLDAGHAVNIGAADQFDAAVTAFLSAH